MKQVKYGSHAVNEGGWGRLHRLHVLQPSSIGGIPMVLLQRSTVTRGAA